MEGFKGHNSKHLLFQLMPSRLHLFIPFSSLEVQNVRQKIAKDLGTNKMATDFVWEPLIIIQKLSMVEKV